MHANLIYVPNLFLPLGKVKSLKLTYPNMNNYIFHQQTFLVPLWKKNEYIAKENLSLVAYVQSSCDTPSGRDEYVSELMKHIKVDSYGHCLHNTDLPSSLRNPTVNKFSIFKKNEKQNSEFLNFLMSIFFRVFIKVSLKTSFQIILHKVML